MSRFNCEDCGELNEYVGCKIEQDGKKLKITQLVLMQSLKDEFELPNTRYTTSAVPKNVLTKVAEELALDGKDQTKYWSGVGKLLHSM